MEQGWIKLHRKLLENPIMRKQNYLALWVVLLLRANHEDNRIIWNGKDTPIKAGQFITGRKSLHEDTGIPETTIERILDYLESGHQIGQQKNNKYRLITILNWNNYQNRTSKQTTNGHLADTNKNVKNEKKYTLKSKIKEEPEKDVKTIKSLLEKYKPNLK